MLLCTCIYQANFGDVQQVIFPCLDMGVKKLSHKYTKTTQMC